MPSATAKPLPRSRRVSKRQAANHAGINPQTLDDFITEVGLTVYRAGPNVFRIDLDELDEAMRAYGREGP